MSNTQPFILYIQTNSPGELSNWVYPIVEKAQKLYPNIKIIIYLVPCQYASKKEKEIAEKIPGVSEVWSIKKTLTELKKGWFSKKTQNGAILYLGGDPLYAQLMGLKLKIPSYAYTAHSKKTGLFFKQTFYKKESGDLMAERVKNTPLNKSKILEKENLDKEPDLLFFTSSRKEMFKAYAPFIIEVIEHIQKKDPTIQSILQFSPFIDKTETDIIEKSCKKKHIKTSSADSKEIMSISKWLITLPGTNTAEAQYLTLPMIVLIPLNRPDLIIFDGLLGILGKIPLLGTLLKKIAITIVKQKKQFYAHPNRNANEDIVPEYSGNLTAKDTAEFILNQFYNTEKHKEIKKKLSALKEEKTPSETILNKIMETA